MRLALLLVLFAVPALAQEPVNIPTQADWVGPLESQDSGGRTVLPTRVSLQFNGTEVIGHWVGLTPARPSGDIKGTIERNGAVKVTVTFHALGILDDGTMEAERCQGEGRFTGTILPTGVFRWTSQRMTFSTPVKRQQGRDCEDLTRLTWTLQLRETES